MVEVVSNPILGKKSEFVKKLDRHFPPTSGGFFHLWGRGEDFLA